LGNVLRRQRTRFDLLDSGRGPNGVKMDLRVVTIDVSRQEVMTRDICPGKQ